MYIDEERETIITTDDLEDKWTVYTRQPKLIQKLTKLGYQPFRVELDGSEMISAEFVMNLSQISFKKLNLTKRTYTPEQREQMAERMRQNRKNRGNTNE